ncbi:AI-2E family transporter [Clostridium sp. 'deep sea']|uniref:AI-2E family transporter n=1 Tax=Clostridium sp. 'deep sea' TaxID=2779445 RepID=UPI0018968840|nr:AI-2E family transporter [Clostridium sp. 'deep sea']QOR34042.1 AI-2E family transporter [Clostridium sp. 'deep sea']
MSEDIKRRYFSRTNIILYILTCIFIVRLVMVDNILQTIWGSLGEVTLAIILIYLLNPLVRTIEEKFKMSRSSSVALSYLILVLVIVALIMIISPAVVDSIKSLANAVPNYEQTLIEITDKLDLEKFNISGEILNSIIKSLNEIVLKISQSLISVIDFTINSARVILLMIVKWVIALLIAWYGLKEYPNLGKHMQKHFKALFKPRTAKKLTHIMELSDTAFRGFIIGKLVTCAILGGMTYVAMFIFNLVTPYTIPFLPLIGIIIGLTNMIPYFGPLLGAIPCIIMALFTGIPEGIAVVVIILVLQQIDNLIVGPRVLGSYVGISPFWTLVFISIGGKLNGAIGMIIAVPIGTVILLLFQEYLKEKLRKKKRKSEKALI